MEPGEIVAALRLAASPDNWRMANQELLDSSADLIERLVRERDEAHDLLRLACHTAEIEAIWDKSVCRGWYYEAAALIRARARKE